jgi:transketolase
MLWLAAHVSPATRNSLDRDRIVVSHGHTSAAVYSVLGNLGFFPLADALTGYRTCESIYEGHASHKVPGVDWGSGSLGQGLSVGSGFALAARLRKADYHSFVVMGDGEQQKGQHAEAARFAARYQLSNLTGIIDFNHLQAMGATGEIMPQALAREYRAYGWNVVDVDGHDLAGLYVTLKSARDRRNKPCAPTLLLAHTVMGSGVSFIENRHEWHGKPLTPAELQNALAELGDCSNVTDGGRLGVASRLQTDEDPSTVETQVPSGTPRVYPAGTNADPRSAFGEALYDIVKACRAAGVPVAVLDCDLAGSVKTDRIWKDFPECFIQCGIQEHHAASLAAALSQAGVLTFFAEFAVFGIDETYGQHRMNDLNHATAKFVCTHAGLDVGEDGKTHQSIDYVSLISNLFGYRLIIPADANQTDRVIRYIASTPGAYVVAMGRSKVPVIDTGEGAPFFPASHVFEYGKADWLRRGRDGVIVTTGVMAGRAITAREILHHQGVDVGVLHLSCPCELDTAALREAAATGLIVTYEDHNIRTGIGSLVGAWLAETGLPCRFQRLGISRYGTSASPEEQYKLQGLDPDTLAATVRGKLRS